MNLILIFSIFILYMTFLFFMGYLTDRRQPVLLKISQHPLTYAFALGIYCTTWTYYGSVGIAATSGMTFLGFYIGPTLCFFLWPFFLKKLIRIRQVFRLTSIADFISARYSQSGFLAALVTIIAAIGLIPYGALQIKASFTTFEILIQHLTMVDLQWARFSLVWLLLALMILFSIIFGARRLDSAQPHHGLLLSVAIQSLVQLLAFLCIGVYVTFFLHNGFNSILEQLNQIRLANNVQIGYYNPEHYLVWATYIILGMSAIVFLPRQFHVAVVENTDEDHIYTAMWAFPTYMFLITLFTVPIAASGLLQGLPDADADRFVLLIPLLHNQIWLAIVIFLGGLSAAVSMIMISSVTLATMITNHLFLPFIHPFPHLDFLKKHLLTTRWTVIILFIFVCSFFERLVGNLYMLANIGLISFSAVVQFAPCIIGGLYWRKGNKLGAALGLLGGFAIWFYTLFLPMVVKASPSAASFFIEHGPWGIEWLKPEQLFGIGFSNQIVNGVFWSLFFNITFYVFGSLWSNTPPEAQSNANAFIDILKRKKKRTYILPGQEETIAVQNKIELITKILRSYFDDQMIQRLILECLRSLKLEKKEHISLVELSEVRSEMEKVLTGYLGSATAYKLLREIHLFSADESRQLSQTYSQILADFELSPEDLLNKIDYYKEKESLFLIHAQELQEKMLALKASEEKYRTLVQNINIGVYRTTPGPDGHFIEINPTLLKMFGYSKLEFMQKTAADLYENPQDREWVSEKMLKKGYLKNEELRMKKKDGTLLWMSVSSVVTQNALGEKFFDGIIEDITARKKAQEALEQAKNELEQRVKERTIELQIANDQLKEDIVKIKTTEAELKQAHDYLQKTQKQLIRSEKLASIGQLAAGVAHEINNPLGYININVYFLNEYFKKLLPFLKRLKENYLSSLLDQEKNAIDLKKEISAFDNSWEIDFKVTDIQNLIEESLEGIHRITKIVQDLKSFARMDDDVEESVNMNDIVESAINMVWNQIKYKAELVKNYSALPPLRCNKLYMGQVFVNILINAVQAIKDQGKISVTTKREQKNIIILISDTGRGIKKEDLNKIWDPFFTTKDIGHGTGLGLSISYEIVRQHNGNIEIESEEGVGTTIRISLPYKK